MTGCEPHSGLPNVFIERVSEGQGELLPAELTEGFSPLRLKRLNRREPLCKTLGFCTEVQGGASFLAVSNLNPSVNNLNPSVSMWIFSSCRARGTGCIS